MRGLAVAIAVLAIASGATARADGEITLRGVYYKEHATRVEQPMVDGTFDAGDNATVDAHVLVDAITSASAGATADGSAFSERRWEAGLGYTRNLGAWRAGAAGRISTESDYDSWFASGRIARDLADKNTTIALGFGAGRDHITNAGAKGPFAPDISEHLVALMGTASLTQILSTNALASVTYDLGILDGYLENPYRTVITADGLVGERVPQRRTRNAVAALVRNYFPSTETTLIASYRYYRDGWGVHAHTPEVRVVQQAGDGLAFGAGFRYYRQTRASFWKPTYPSSDPAMEPFLTDDPKLSAFTGATMTMRFEVEGSVFGFSGLLGAMRGEAIVEYAVQHNRFGNAGVGHVALTVPFEY
ncbi:MAG: DUF3570 domain-containing protein [Deltaproteobacteria bacterium]|nr:DUF3570 domain-containing protein [Deltaproteobacteria bacterium]